MGSLLRVSPLLMLLAVSFSAPAVVWAAEKLSVAAQVSALEEDQQTFPDKLLQKKADPEFLQEYFRRIDQGSLKISPFLRARLEKAYAQIAEHWAAGVRPPETRLSILQSVLAQFSAQSLKSDASRNAVVSITEGLSKVFKAPSATEQMFQELEEGFETSLSALKQSHEARPLEPAQINRVMRSVPSRVFGQATFFSAVSNVVGVNPLLRLLNATLKEVPPPSDMGRKDLTIRAGQIWAAIERYPSLSGEQKEFLRKAMIPDAGRKAPDHFTMAIVGSPKLVGELMPNVPYERMTGARGTNNEKYRMMAAYPDELREAGSDLEAQLRLQDRAGAEIRKTLGLLDDRDILVGLEEQMGKYPPAYARVQQLLNRVGTRPHLAKNPKVLEALAHFSSLGRDIVRTLSNRSLADKNLLARIRTLNTLALLSETSSDPKLFEPILDALEKEKSTTVLKTAADSILASTKPLPFETNIRLRRILSSGRLDTVEGLDLSQLRRRVFTAGASRPGGGSGNPAPNGDDDGGGRPKLSIVCAEDYKFTGPKKP
jgi:hypothetical protein